MTKKQLYKKIRGAFIGKGTSFNKWCIANNFRRQNASAAILGTWIGPKATEITNLAIADSGIDPNTDCDDSDAY